MTYTLTRFSQTEQGTLGWLKDPQGQTLCMTLEPSPDEAHPCIPESTYHCIQHNGEHWKNVWELQNVPGRTAILIHAGNFETDTLGCLCVGDSYQVTNNRLMLLNSVATLNKLRAELPQEFDLQIIKRLIP